MFDFRPIGKTFLQLFPVDSCCFSSAGDNLCKKVLITRIGELLVNVFICCLKGKECTGMQSCSKISKTHLILISYSRSFKYILELFYWIHAYISYDMIQYDMLSYWDSINHWRNKHKYMYLIWDIWFSSWKILYSIS